MQERFGDVEVIWGPSPTQTVVNGDSTHKELQRINVIEALLKLTLEPAPLSLLDARLAACECIKAFFANHTGIRVHVLGRAIQGHISGEDQIPNILTVLLMPPETRGNADPYQTWMASVLMYQLLFENAEAKSIAMGVTEGDAEQGEEVVTCIQTIVGNLITGIQRGDDERITLGYLMLLCGWLFEEPDAVNDFLGEGSSIQTLLQEIKHRGATYVLVPGLSTILLGIIYEFSSKDSPIPRKTLHKLLIEQLGREQYIDRITRFREDPLVRDFEVLPQTVGAHYDGGLPEIYFDRTFVEFLKDNFSRLIRAIDREPEIEISVITNGVERGVSRELVDSLRAELEEKGAVSQKLESDLLALQSKLDHEQAEHRKTRDATTLESSKLQQICESLKRSHEQELNVLKEQQKHAQNVLLKQHGEQLRAIDRQLKETSADHERRSLQVKKHHEAEVADLQKKIRSLESDLKRGKEQSSAEIADLKTTIQLLKSEAEKTKGQHVAEVLDLNSTLQNLQSALDADKGQHAAELSDLNATIQRLQSELETGKGQHATEVSGLNKTIEELKSQMDSIQGKHESEVSDLNKTIQKLQSELDASSGQSAAEVSDLKKTIETLQSELDSSNEQNATEVSDLKKTIESLQSELENGKGDQAAEVSSLQETIKTFQSDMDAARKQHETEVAELKSASKALQSELDTTKEKSTKELQSTRDELSNKCTASEKRAEKAEGEVAKAEEAARKASQALEEARKQLEKAEAEAKEKEEARKAAQSELEDLLIVFGDLEAKRNQDKVSPLTLIQGLRG